MCVFEHRISDKHNADAIDKYSSALGPLLRTPKL